MSVSVRDILDRTDLTALLTELSGPAVGAGGRTRWRCCAADHADEHPSVTMRRGSDGVERWRCWSGGHGGTALDAVIVAHHLTVPDACRWLETRAGLTPTTAPVAPRPARRAPSVPRSFSDAARHYAHACAHVLWTPAGRRALGWLHDRGLPDDVLAANQVGFDPGTGRLARADGLPRRSGVTYPSFNPAGDMVYVQTRHLDGNGPKYSNPTGTHGPLPTVTYPRTPTTVGVVIVTEGVPDGLIAVAAGFRAAAVLSASLANAATASELARFAAGTELCLAFDNDPAGQAAQHLLRRHLADTAPVRVLRLPDGRDLTESYATTARSRPPTPTPTPIAGR